MSALLAKFIVSTEASILNTTVTVTAWKTA